MVFKILFTTLKNFRNSIFSGFALLVGYIIKDKSIVIVVIFAQHLSFSLNGTNSLSSSRNFISL